MSPLLLLLVVPLTNPPSVVNQPHVDALWEFVQTLAGRKDPPPIVYFTSEEEPPASTRFLAFYYEQTRIVRISPLVVQQTRLASLGYVYLVLGHEMLHYVLVDRVPMEKHHCLFVQEGFREQIAEFLVQNGIGHPFLQVMREEADGCE